MKRKYSQEAVSQLMFGRIYVNKNDSRIFVRRRGIGSWTMNFGNKWTWVIMGAELIIISIILLIVFLI